MCLLWSLDLLALGKSVRISSQFQPNLKQQLSQTGLSTHLSCNAPEPIPLRFQQGGKLANHCFSNRSSRVPVGPLIPFVFVFLRRPPTERFHCVLQVNLSVRDKLRRTKQLTESTASGPNWSSLGLSRSVFGLFGAGWRKFWSAVGHACLYYDSFMMLIILHSAWQFPISFRQAWSNIWAKLARAPICSLMHRSKSHSSLDDLPSKHGKYVFPPNGPKGIPVGLPFHCFFRCYGGSPINRTLPYIYIYIYIYIRNV